MSPLPRRRLPHALQERKDQGRGADSLYLVNKTVIDAWTCGVASDYLCPLRVKRLSEGKTRLLFDDYASDLKCPITSEIDQGCPHPSS